MAKRLMDSIQDEADVEMHYIRSLVDPFNV